MIAGNNQDVDWRSRIEIIERNNTIVLVHLFARTLSGNNPAKYAILVHKFIDLPGLFHPYPGPQIRLCGRVKSGSKNLLGLDK